MQRSQPTHQAFVGLLNQRRLLELGPAREIEALVEREYALEAGVGAERGLGEADRAGLRQEHLGAGQIDAGEGLGGCHSRSRSATRNASEGASSGVNIISADTSWTCAYPAEPGWRWTRVSSVRASMTQYSRTPKRA